MKLIAIKPFSYSTRHYQAGDIFETKTERDGKLLLAVKKVRQLEDRPEEKVPAPPKSLLNKITEEVSKTETKKEEVSEPEEEVKPEVKDETPKETDVPKETFVRSNHNNSGRGRSRKN